MYGRNLCLLVLANLILYISQHMQALLEFLLCFVDACTAAAATSPFVCQLSATTWMHPVQMLLFA
jgi:hypothetical protein